MAKANDVKNAVEKRAETTKANEGNMKTALVKLAARLDVSKDVLQKTLMQTAFKECKTSEDFVTGVIVANTYGLNPLLRELYIFPARGGGITPIVSIDGWISLVNRQEKFNGVELLENEDKDGELKSVTAIFHLKTTDNPVKVTEYMSECYDENKEPWRRWKRRMLRHKAYIQGARVAFGFSGIYDADEGERIAQGQQIAYSPEQETVSTGMTADMGATYDTVETATDSPADTPQGEQVPEVEDKPADTPKQTPQDEYAPISSNSDADKLRADILIMLAKMGKTLLEYTAGNGYKGTDDVNKLKATIGIGKKKSQLMVQHSIIKKDYMAWQQEVPTVDVEDDIFTGTEDREPGMEG